MEEQMAVTIKVDATDAVARGWNRCGTVRVAVDPSSWDESERGAIILATNGTREGLSWRSIAGLPQTLDERGLLDAALAYAAECAAEDERLAQEYLDDPGRVELPYRESVAKRADVQAEHARRREAAHERAKATLLLASDRIWDMAAGAVPGGHHLGDLTIAYDLRRYLDTSDPEVRARFERDRERTVERLDRLNRERAERAEAEQTERERAERARLDEARIVLGAEWTETDEARVTEGRMPAPELRGRIANRLLPVSDTSADPSIATYERLHAEDVEHDDECSAYEPDDAIEFSAEDEGENPYPLTAPQYESLASIRATVAELVDLWSDVLTLTSTVTLRLHTARCTSCGERTTRYGVRVRVETPSGWSASREYALR